MPDAFTRDRRANCVFADYYTCLAVRLWVTAEMNWEPRTQEPEYTTARSLECSSHNCSCSLPALSRIEAKYSDTFFESAASTITISGTFWDLSDPPLKIGIRASSSPGKPDWLSQEFGSRHPQKASDFWSGSSAYASRAEITKQLDGSLFKPYQTVYMWNDTLLTNTTVIDNSRCIAEDAYSWGFSSLLLLTFCCYTFAFALALILLQTDVYWNSRNARNHQSHSIYTDVLYLAEELKTTFGQNVEDHMRSPKAFDKKVGEWKQGLRLDVSDMPLSRWQQRRLYLATKWAAWKAKISPPHATQSTAELHNMSSPAGGGSAGFDTAYHGLIRGNGESNFEAVSRSDDRSSSEELAPSLGCRRTSTENFFRNGAALEGSVQESYLAASTHAADGVP
jgi:hypothetical protein